MVAFVHDSMLMMMLMGLLLLVLVLKTGLMMALREV